MRLSLPARSRAQWRISLVYWLTLFGVILWTVAAASGRISGTPPIQMGPFVIVLILETVNLILRSLDRIRRDRHPELPVSPLSGWVFVTVDLVIFAAGLRFTGGAASPLWVIIFLSGVAETLLATPSESHTIRYGAILALLLGTIPYPPTSTNSAYVLDMAIRIGSIVAVTSVTRRLRENNDAKERENAALRAELGLAEERSKLSRDIHDGIGNSLAASVLRLEFAARTLEKEQPGDTAVPVLKDEAQALREAMTQVRDWTFFTKPWSVGGGPEEAALSARLITEVDRLARRTSLPMTLTGAELVDSLPSTARLTVLRIVQEGLTNAAKHATGASQVEVALRRDGHTLMLTIADDGCGFDPEAAGCGVGFASMRERAESVGGTFTLDSAPGLGVTLTVLLPAV